MNYQVKIRKVYNTDKPVKALASVTIDDKIVIHGIRIIETPKKRFLSMPFIASKDAEGKDVLRDMVHPVSAEANKELECAVFSAYEIARKELVN